MVISDIFVSAFSVQIWIVSYISSPQLHQFFQQGPGHPLIAGLLQKAGDSGLTTAFNAHRMIYGNRQDIVKLTEQFSSIMRLRLCNKSARIISPSFLTFYDLILKGVDKLVINLFDITLVIFK
ncbi:hypothetical protein GSD09_001147 [Salmonella enterica]|nr:hypothetical protein [Salmonella enterica]